MDHQMVAVLGEEFTFAQAEAYAEQKHRPAREKAEVRRQEHARKVAEALEKAKATGKPVAIETRLVGETDSGHVFETVETLRACQLAAVGGTADRTLDNPRFLGNKEM